jgi:hypothetical protein
MSQNEISKKRVFRHHGEKLIAAMKTRLFTDLAMMARSVQGIIPPTWRDDL